MPVRSGVQLTFYSALRRATARRCALIARIDGSDSSGCQMPPREQVGTVCMRRGAVNQKGPQNAFLSALMAFHASGKKLPVNLVLVCEGEEEIGSPHFGEIVMTNDVLQALKSCAGVLLPSADQKPDGSLEVELGAKGT